ncbi:serine hydrolase domain-containing protein [Actinocatenispora rupis]|uniref:Esterase n=1 Tax=Actinocatenispora rupis TaxID=519421 RepID=A0A8J3NDF4_9ACTN|nr:serine hydrolase [Actinocatenispora rupis]GID12847.1 esterase [Actinocatenispora rupis]
MQRDRASALAEIVRDLTDAGVPGVLLRVADRTGTVVEHLAGHRRTYRMVDGPGWLPGPGEGRRELRRLDDPPPMTPDAVFDLASVSKLAGTTAALMSLTDAGLVDPDAPARDWLPDLPVPVRLRDLLRHRAGLAEWWPVYAGAGEPGAVAAGVPARYPVGAGRHYSDLGFMLLGRVVERAAGEPLADATRRLVFDPAGMTGAHYRPGGAGPAVPLVATGHGDWYERRMIATGNPYPTGVSADAFDRWREYTIEGEVHDGNAWHAFGGVAGHAGLFGGADDLVAYGRALLDADGPWRPDTVARFTAAGPDPGQGLGFWRWPEYGAVGHAGFTGIRFAVLPASGAIVVLMTNRVHAAGTDLLDLGPYWDRTLATVRDEA